MFVFPAFDVAYKSRKRVHRCCERCRDKRIKCKVSSLESIGCDNCKKSSTLCSLFKTAVESSNSGTGPSTPTIITNNSSNNPNDNNNNNSYSSSDKSPKKNSGNSNAGASSSKKSNQNQFQGHSGRLIHGNESLRPHEVVEFTLSPPASMIPLQDMTTITPQFLKKNFKFNVSNMLDERAYQYVFHDHPKVLINNKTTSDKTYYHESGVHVDYLRPNRKKPKLNHIKDKRTFEYLISINAFSITTGEFAFTDDEVMKLIEIYFDKINSILPMVGEVGYQDEMSKGIFPTILIFCIVLVILKDNVARPIIAEMFSRMTHRKDIPYSDNYREWSFQLGNKIRQIILVLPQLGDFDKYTRLLTLLLLSNYYGFDRFGNEKALHDLTDAVNTAYLLGIHMRRQILEISVSNSNTMNELWWCVFVLDRFNALVNCRSLFIRQNDFNVDLPKRMNLLKLVQVARSLENMLYDVYRPFQVGSNHLRSEIYKLDEFQNLEFQYCYSEQLQFKAREGANNNDTAIPFYLELPCISVISRIVNNAIILTSQKKKYDDPTVSNEIPEAIAFRASQNIMWYILHQNPNLLVDIPIISWCLALALSVSLKRRAKMILNYSSKSKNNAINDVNSPTSLVNQWSVPGIPDYQWTDFLIQLQKFCTQYWVVDEICKLSKEFGDKLEAKFLKQGTSNSNKRQKLGKSLIRGVTKNLQGKESIKVDNVTTPIEGVAIGAMTGKDSNNLSGNVPINMGNANVTPVGTSSVDAEGNLLTTEMVNTYLTPNFNTSISNTDTNLNSEMQSSELTPESLDLNGMSYDDYFGTLQIDLFDNDWFMELPNVQNYN